MVEMDILIISNIIVAFGTLTLAYSAYRNIKSSKEQLKFLRSQTRIFSSQQEPYLLVQNKKFKGNKIELSLNNHGGGTAYDVAVSTRFFITEVKLTNESERLLRETPRKKRDKLNIQGRFNLLPNRPLLVEKNKEEIKNGLFNKAISRILKRPIDYEIVYPSSATTFIFNSQNEQSILESGEANKLFEFEPYFLVTTKKNEKEFKFGTSSKAFLFDELKDFLLQNNIQFIGIVFYLVSRDKIENVHHHQEIDSCIVDLKENKTLEDAVNSGRKGYLTTLGWAEIQKGVGWMPSYLYNEIKFVEE